MNTTEKQDSPPRDDLLELINTIFEDYGYQIPERDFKYALKRRSDYTMDDFLVEFKDYNEILSVAGYDIEITDEELLRDIRRVGRTVSGDDGTRAPTSIEYNEHGNYSYSLCRTRFGSWANALDKAGFDPTESHLERPSRERLIEELERLDSEFDQRPTAKLVKEEGKFSVSAYQKEFGSFCEALHEIGYVYETAEQRSREELLEDLERIDEKVDGPILTKHLDKYGIASPTAYIRRFGGMEEIRDLLGYEDVGTKKYTDEEVLNEVSRLMEKHGDDLTIPVFNEEADISVSVLYSRFGSWGEAKKRASSGEVDTEERSRSYSDEELIEDLKSIDDEVDGRLRTRHLEEHGIASPNTYTRRFGGMEEIRDLIGYEDTGQTKYGRSEILSEVSRVLSEKGEDVSFTEFIESVEFSSSVLYREFDSWSEAKDAALASH